MQPSLAPDAQTFPTRDIISCLLPEISTPGSRAVVLHMRQYDNACDTPERGTEMHQAIREAYPLLNTAPSVAQLVETFRTIHPGLLEKSSAALVEAIGPQLSVAEAEEAIIRSFEGYQGAVAFMQFLQDKLPPQTPDMDQFAQRKYAAEQAQDMAYEMFRNHQKNQLGYWAEHMEEVLGPKLTLAPLPPNPATNIDNVSREEIARFGARAPQAVWLLSIAKSHGIPLRPEDIQYGAEMEYGEGEIIRTVVVAPTRSDEGVPQPILKALFAALDKANFIPGSDLSQPTIPLARIFVGGTGPADDRAVSVSDHLTFEETLSRHDGRPALTVPLLEHSDHALHQYAETLVMPFWGRGHN